MEIKDVRQTNQGSRQRLEVFEGEGADDHLVFELRPTPGLPIIDLVNGKAQLRQDPLQLVLAHDVALGKAER